MSTTAPFGSWTSPITAESLAAGGHPVTAAARAGRSIWWSERRPTERGRVAIRSTDAAGAVFDVLPAPFSAQSRVHEYGGSSWTVLRPDSDAPELCFAEGSDQRLYRFVPGGQPQPLTPAGGGMRFAEPQVVELGSAPQLLALRETHQDAGRGVQRDLVLVPLDGSAAEEPGRIRSLVAGSDFLAYPRLSPDGTRLAWIAWDHPQMPWDGTELRLAELPESGGIAEWTVLLGSTQESVLQPEWAGDDAILVVADGSGWWNLQRVELGSGDGSTAGAASVTPITAEPAEYAGPLWQLGARWFIPEPDGGVLAVRCVRGADELVRIAPGAAGGSSEVTVIDTGLSGIQLQAVDGQELLLIGEAATVPGGLRVLDLARGTLQTVRLHTTELPDAAYLPEAAPFTAEGPDGEVHAFVYSPRNPGFQAPAGELPPYVAFVHGGPTAHAGGGFNLSYAYLTSRGIGVIDVNYGGSTGYGRAYRERLRGQWGVVDVADTVAAVQGLVEAGLADAERLAIRGGSAGGWTVLRALTTTGVFACGISRYGVADLLALTEDTHDFEARYLDGLVGQLPESLPRYRELSPLAHLDGLNCPVLLLQGLEDKVVPPAQSEAVRDALAERGIPHAYLSFEGEAHGFRRAETIIAATEAELSFLAQILGFEAAEVPELPLQGGF